MKCAFLYNPNSGRGKIKHKTAEIEQRLRGLFGEVVAEETSDAAEAATRAKKLARSADVLVFAGGDGTFHTVVESVAGTEVTLGYIPSGTANDAAASLGIPKRVKAALGVIARGRTAKVDCLQINGAHRAISIVAAGSMTRVTYETAQRKKRAFGWFAYAFDAFRRAAKMQPFYAEAACGETRAEGNFALALIMNGKKAARFSVNRGADMCDGVCEAAFIRQAGSGFGERWGAFFALARALLFGMKHGGKRLVFLRGNEIEVRKTDSVLWDFDGERGVKGEICVRVVPAAVKVFVP